MTLKEPGVLSQFRLAKILGEAARNQVYFDMVTPIIFVSSINGRGGELSEQRARTLSDHLVPR